MSDWIARKLAERLNQPPAPAYPPPAYPQQTVAPSNYPRTQQPAIQQPQPQQQFLYPGQQQPLPSAVPAPQDIDRTVDPNDPFGTAIRAALAASDTGHTTLCPECHQDSVYQPTTNESGYPLRDIPLPRCTSCGWPRLQSGSIHGGATLAKSSGRAKAARQLSNHNVEIYGAVPGIPVGGFEAQPGGTSYV